MMKRLKGKMILLVVMAVALWVLCVVSRGCVGEAAAGQVHGVCRAVSAVLIIA